MRRLLLCLLAACAIAVPAASAAQAKDDNGVMCVLHAKLTAEADTGSTSTAKGHTEVKVWDDGTVQFKTQIDNKDGETFIAGHIHAGAAGTSGPPVEML